LRFACIDIGSNTTRLLVAEPDGDGLREVLSQRTFTRLPCGGGAIPPQAVAEVAAAVATQTRLASECGAAEVAAVATAAVRRADNGPELCRAVRDAAGVEVAVLSGADEARLAFAGATRTLGDVPAGRVAVADVGGGSTELVCGTAGAGVEWAVSLPVGSGLLADTRLSGDPPSEEGLDAARLDVATAFAGTQAPRPEIAYAVGGSATSLRRLVGAELDRATLAHGVALLCAGPADEVARRHELHPERVRVLPAAMLVLDAVVALLGRPLLIASGGLREGVILERIAHAAV
jgi:exopolyphosphatase/guanosine-5'-triphosphate,3'-diphosphate pyrophosphatase